MRITLDKQGQITSDAAVHRVLESGFRVLTLTLALVLGTGSIASADRRAVPSEHGAAPAAMTGGSIGDLAADLDYDVERIYRFVDDEIRYEPYDGMLRGAAGTLEAGAGNSVDKALLLAELLDESLVTYRFAQGPLDDAGVRAAIDATVSTTAAARTASEALLKPDGDAIRLVAASPDPTATDSVDVQAAVDAATDSAGQQLSETVAMLEGALASADVELALPGVALPAMERDSHTWVQVAQGAEWMDLDPMVPGAEPGSSLAVPASTSDALGDELRHKLTFEVLVERVEGDELVTRPSLTYSAYADELHAVPIVFAHLEPSGAEGLGLALQALAGTGALRYTPILQVGGRSFVGDEGVEFGVGASDGGGGLFGDTELLEAEGPDDLIADGEATAEWLEISVESPGGASETARRTVFDRLPADIRWSGQPTPAEVQPPELISVDETSQDVAPLLGVQAIAVATAPMAAERILGLMVEPAPNPPTLLALGYHSLRDALATEVILDEGIRTYADGPNITSFIIDVGAGESGPEVALGLDIWHRHVATLPVTDGPAAASPPNLVASVLAQVTERVALEAGRAESDPDVPAPVGVSSVFDSAAAAGIPAVVLAGELPAELPYGAQANALISDAVTSGNVVVIPSAPVEIEGRPRSGWWQIDPRTGSAIDSMDDGTGAEVVEEPANVSKSLKAGRCFVAFAPAIFTAIGLYAAYDKRTAAAGAAAFFAVLYSQVMPKLNYFNDVFPKDFKC